MSLRIFQWIILAAPLVILFSLPLFIPSWHGKLIAFAFILWLFSRRKSNVNALINNHFFLTTLLLLLVSLLGLTYTNNLKSGLLGMESILPLLVVSLMVFSSLDYLGISRIRYSFIAFVIGVIALNISSLFFISKDLWDPINLQANIILANNYIVQIHPAFLSLYISFCIFFLVDQYFPIQTENRRKLGWIIFSLIILVAYLIWINSRTGIFTFFVGAIFYVGYKYRGKQLLISLVSLSVIIVLVVTLPFSSERFFKSPIRALPVSSLDVSNPNVYPLVARKQIFDCSIELLKGSEFFYGYGTGDFRDELRECYKEKGYTWLYEKGLDAHNEYLAQMHRHGIIGLTLFLALLIIPFRYAIKHKSPLLAVFVILFAVTAMFETVLSSQKSASFYALFCPLLMLFAKQNAKHNQDLN